MTKAEILQEITKAKIAHKRWVKRADHLISGLPIDKEFIPLEATTCGFGKWLYSQGTQLRTIEATRYIIEEIEHHHDDLHDAYSKIYTLYFIVPENKSFLSKVLTFNSKKVTKKDKEKAKAYFIQLLKSSEELLTLLDKLEKASEHITYEQLISRS
jgi:uncharacterized protein Yka (UPF0111/DUF47 family)